MNLESDKALEAYIKELSKKTIQYQYEDLKSSSNEDFIPSEIGSISTSENDSNPSMKENSPAKPVSKLKLLEQKYSNKAKTKLKPKQTQSLFKTEENDVHKQYIDNKSSSIGDSDDILNLDNVLSFHDVDEVNEESSSVNPPSTRLNSDIKFNKLTTENKLVGKPQKIPFKKTNFKGEKSSLIVSADNPNQESDIFNGSGMKPNLIRRSSSTTSLLMQRGGVFYSRSVSTENTSNRKNSIIPVFKDEVHWATESIDDTSNTITESVVEDLPDLKSHINKESKNISVMTSLSDIGDEKSNLKVDRNLKSETNAERKTSDQTVQTYSEPKKVSKKKNHEKKKLHKHSTRKGSSLSDNQSFSDEFSSSSLSSSFHSSLSSSSTSSSLSSSCYRSKCKCKKSRKKRRSSKSKREKHLVKLMTKTMLKVLPKVCPDSYGFRTGGFNRDFYTIPPSQINISKERSSASRVDDALRQTIELTRHFVNSHQTLYEAYSSLLLSHHRTKEITKMEKYLNTRVNGQPPPSLNQAYLFLERRKRKKRKHNKRGIRKDKEGKRKET